MIAGADACMVASLFAIAKSTRAFVALHLSQLGLHPGQDQLLGELELGEPVSVSALADRLAVRPSTVSKMLDRLIEKDLVRRMASDGDARRTLVMLTEQGSRIQLDVRGVWSRIESELAAALLPGEKAAVSEALTRIETVLAVRLRRLR